MAWRNDGDGIAAIGSAHSAHRCRRADLTGDLAIRPGLAIGDREKRLPHRSLKVRAGEGERQREHRAPTVEILFELPSSLRKHRMSRILRRSRQPNASRVVILPK